MIEKGLRSVIFPFLLLFPSIVFSQNIAPQVCASAGSFYTQSQGSLSFTVGELAEIQTFSHSSISLVLTQGFQQADPIGSLSLPLIDFNGRRDKQVVKLEWKVSAEAPGSLYRVMRSQDGRNFRQIGEVNGVNDNRQASYAYLDERAYESVLYYRLVLAKVGSPLWHSRIIRLTDRLTMPEVNPNPVREMLRVSLVSESASIREIQVLSGDGRTVKRFIQNLLPGHNQFYLPFQDLPAGIYWLSGIDFHPVQIIKL